MSGTPITVRQQWEVADVVLNPYQLTHVPYLDPGFTPDFVNDDTGAFSLPGDETGWRPGTVLTMSGSTGNDGEWTVAYSVLTPTVNILSADNGASTFTVEGDMRSWFVGGDTLTVTGTNAGSFTLTSATLTLGNTVLLVTVAPITTTADGTIVSDTLRTAVYVTTPIPDNTADGTLTGPGVELVPSPGEGRAIMPTSYMTLVSPDTNGSAWGQDSLTVFFYGNAATPGHGFSDTSDLVDGAEGHLNTTGLVDHGFVYLGESANSILVDTTLDNVPINNQPITMKASQDPSTGGTGTRSLYVRMYYLVVPTDF